jgi:hypothetical protein
MSLKHNLCEVEIHYKFFTDFLKRLVRETLVWWLQNQEPIHFL